MTAPKQIQFRLPADYHAIVEQWATEAGKPIGRYVKALIMSRVDRIRAETLKAQVTTPAGRPMNYGNWTPNSKRTQQD